jgi:2-oxo-4-hydroxy-4-carboxy-5-ureidoimidazoline decarboxylase
MSRAEFVNLLGAVFEETPAIAEQAWAARPFLDIADLHQKMVAIVEQMSPDEKLALIQAHPELGNRAKMADASVQEQLSAGLNQLNPADYQRIQSLNAAYRQKFGFPYVMAIKGHSISSILATLEIRLGNNSAAELTRSLSEIYQIARFRLAALIDSH